GASRASSLSAIVPRRPRARSKTRLSPSRGSAALSGRSAFHNRRREEFTRSETASCSSKGGEPMSKVVRSLAAVGAFLSLPFVSAVQSEAALSSCSLDGTYAITSTLFAGSESGQMSGDFVFTPAGDCASGTVHVVITIFYTDRPAPISGALDLPY